MLNERWNFFGPTVAGYRLSTYRRLPVGWSPAPLEIWADLHMWRKFLRLEGISAATRFAIESIALRSANRPGVTMQERAAETERWFQIVSDAEARSALRGQIAAAMAKRYAAMGQRLWLREKQVAELSQARARLKGQIVQRDERCRDLKNRLVQRDAALARQAAKAEQQLLARQEEIGELSQVKGWLKQRLLKRNARSRDLKKRFVKRDSAAAAEAVDENVQ